MLIHSIIHIVRWLKIFIGKRTLYFKNRHYFQLFTKAILARDKITFNYP
jgi:hypothetical protein